MNETEKGENKIETYEFSVRDIVLVEKIAIIYLHRKWDKETNTPENQLQAPIFLASEGVTLKDPIESFYWEWEIKADNLTMNTLRHRFLNHEASLRSVNVHFDKNVSQFPKHCLPEVDDSNILLIDKEELQHGSAVISIYSGIPVLIGVVIDSISGCPKKVTCIHGMEKSIKKVTEEVVYSLSWYYPSATYVEYVKGDIHNRIYYKWWAATYNETMQESQKAIEEELTGVRINNESADALYVSGYGSVAEILDHRHRYGMCLKLYHTIYKEAIKRKEIDSNQSFFEWLDFGEGRAVDIVPRSKLHSMCIRSNLENLNIKFCNEIEREAYEVSFHIDQDSARLKLLYKHNGKPVKASSRHKWIYVWDLSRRFYVNKKKHGSFQHSSFLSGRPVLCAGTIITDKEGYLIALSRKSGHYKSYEKNLYAFKDYLSHLGANMDAVQIDLSLDD